jgi:hypothetical protein
MSGGALVTCAIIVEKIEVGIKQNGDGVKYAFIDIYFRDHDVNDAIEIAKETVRLGIKPSVGIYMPDEEEHIVVIFSPLVGSSFVRRVIQPDAFMPYLAHIVNGGARIMLVAEAVLNIRKFMEFLGCFQQHKTFTLNIVKRNVVMWATELNVFGIPSDPL